MRRWLNSPNFVDEAHKGSGDYAYAQVIRYLMAKNPHFRVLALTATPGSTPEAVQGIVDSLHISHIEIRDENSIDLRGYMHKKHSQQHIVPIVDELGEVKNMISEMMTVITSSFEYTSYSESHILCSYSLWSLSCRSSVSFVETQTQLLSIHFVVNQL